MSGATALSRFFGGIFSGAVWSLKSGFESRSSVARNSVAFKESSQEKDFVRRPYETYDHASTLCYADTLYGDTILIVDPRGIQRDMPFWLANNCLKTRTLKTVSKAGQTVDSGEQQVGLVVVDLESCGGIASIVSDLMAFRQAYVDTPVILISADSEVDDFSTERLAIGDVTLRGPVSVSRLDLALAEAQINNQVWQARNPAHLQ